MTEEAMSLKERFNPIRFLRGEKPVDHPVTLNHRRIFILPTLRGLGFVLLTTLLLLIAFVYNNNLAYLLSFLLASVFFVTILHTFKVLSGLMLSPARSHNAFAGEAAGFAIHINNPASQSRQFLQLSLQTKQTLRLEGSEQKTVVLYTETHRRGWLDCDTVTLSTTYPLGLFRAWSPLRFNLHALVYPKPSNLDIPFPQTDGISGEQGQGRKGSDDFFGIKTYQSGDPIRLIHWKAYAKGQGLFSKEYSGMANVELWLDYNVTPGQDVEERLSQLCRWIIDAEQAGLQYGLILPGTKFPPAHGMPHYDHCLEALAMF